MNFLKLTFSITLMAGLLSCTTMHIQHAPQISGELFRSDDVLKLSIQTDWDALLNDRDSDRQYHPGNLSYYDEVKGEVSLPVELRVRGNFRRQNTNCSFPPVKLKFDPADVEATIFEGQEQLKLFTHCQSEEKEYEQNLLKEYSIYRMYNQLTDFSFRVRLLELSYVNTAKETNPLVRFAFLIESEEELAARLGGEIVEAADIHPDQTERETANNLAVFQYMIGNTDWSIPLLHNIILLKQHPARSSYAIPYDFDFSGFVQAPYAQDNQNPGSSVVSQRRFQGDCRTEKEFDRSFQLFLDKKPSFYSILENQTFMEDRQKQRAINYIDQFYQTINDPQKVKTAFIDKCKEDK